MRKRKLRVGLDFDGVVAYNPFRVIRAPIKWFKRRMLGIRKVSFFVPKNYWQKLAWMVIHESSVFPSPGINDLKEMARSGKYEFHLITGRYGFLKDSLYKWLRRYELMEIFSSININEDCLQPHFFKQSTVNRLRLDFFVEDNLDIVESLGKNTKTQIFWIYNILDRRHSYRNKFPNLGKALKRIE